MNIEQKLAIKALKNVSLQITKQIETLQQEALQTDSGNLARDLKLKSDKILKALGMVITKEIIIKKIMGLEND